MGSSSDMSTIDPWSFRPAFDNSWISETFFRDADAILTKAFHDSISNVGATFTGDVSSSTSETFFDLLKPETPSSQHHEHSFSTSDHETAPKRVSRNQPPAPTGKITKRKKSRVSKRSPTTFITADPSNFRQMVQEVTGVQFATGQVPVLKPEAQRTVGVANRVQGGYILPTLDTSAFWLDHHQPAHSSLGATVAEGHDFEGYSCFPTLDSWKVM